ncbi:hypothetical protein [Heyndrickxia sp. FSL W8-0423]|uniref:hypothetical protein n=1 Tax=Heyndrickxia sp. FSL W8-0423 TaxID=2921601 RepID=UPI0030FB03FC
MPFERGERFDVVYLGEIFPSHVSYIGANIPTLLFNDYVFCFSTMLGQSEDSNVYGQVRIDLVRHDFLSYFNHTLRKQGMLIVHKIYL